MTYRKEIFPGAGPDPPAEGTGMMMMSDQELLTRLRRAAKLYVDPAVRARDPYAIKGIGQHILSYVRELRARGFEVTNQGDTFLIHQKSQVELRRGEHIELVDEATMKRRIYWRVSDAMHAAEAIGHSRRYRELSAAAELLRSHWHIIGISRQKRKLLFEGDKEWR